VLPDPGPPHVGRGPQDVRYPAHVTVRACRSVPSLRSERVFPRLCRAIALANRAAFRVVHFSVQTNHIHFIVEADGWRALGAGLRGLSIRCALAINRAVHRKGQVWARRYHVHPLKTPTEVRRAIAYVLLNHRKHLRAGKGVDPGSSGGSFDGWLDLPNQPASYGPVARPRTWLAGVGWRKAGGAIRFTDLNRR
jgi:REP element-mobilizing transposase RayT